MVLLKVIKKEVDSLNVYEFTLNGKKSKYTYSAIISRINTLTLENSQKELDKMLKIKQAIEKLN